MAVEIYGEREDIAGYFFVLWMGLAKVQCFMVFVWLPFRTGAAYSMRVNHPYAGQVVLLAVLKKSKVNRQKLLLYNNTQVW